MLIPRLVISFRESYEVDGQPSQHGGDAGRQTVQSERMVFERRTMMTDDIELRTVDLVQPVKESD